MSTATSVSESVAEQALTRCERLLLDRLQASEGRVVSCVELVVEGLGWSAPGRNPSGLVRGHLAHVRSKLRPGWVIENHWGRGYRLVRR